MTPSIKPTISLNVHVSIEKEPQREMANIAGYEIVCSNFSSRQKAVNQAIGKLHLTNRVTDLLEVCLGSTYFSHEGALYKQHQGAVIVSPVSAVVASLEFLEELALSTAPVKTAIGM